jgi:DNA-binding response OmpR family regulator
LSLDSREYRWGYEKIPNTRTLDNHILRIRGKLGDTSASPRFIRTVHGVGYCFQADPPAGE